MLRVKKVILIILLGLGVILPAVLAQAQSETENSQILQAIKKFHSSRPGEDWNWHKKHTDKILVSKVGTKAYVVSTFKKQYEAMGEPAGYLMKLINGSWQVVEYGGADIEIEGEKTEPELFEKKNRVNIVLRD